MQPLASVLRALPRSLDAEARAQLAWGLAAGPALADRARLLPGAGGVWRVRPADDGARTQIASVLPELVESLNRVLGPGSVTRIHLERQS